jgi:hypothetical protein
VRLAALALGVSGLLILVLLLLTALPGHDVKNATPAPETVSSATAFIASPRSQLASRKASGNPQAEKVVATNPLSPRAVPGQAGNSGKRSGDPTSARQEPQVHREGVTAAAPAGMLRVRRLSEGYLKSQLELMREVRLGEKIKLSKLIEAHALQEVRQKTVAVLQQQASTADLTRPLSIAPALALRWSALGLPVQTGPNCQLHSAAAGTLQACSHSLGAFLNAKHQVPKARGQGDTDEATQSDFIATPPNSSSKKIVLHAPAPDTRPRDYWRGPLYEVLGVVQGQEVPEDRVAALEQILQTTDRERRLLLVDVLAASQSPRATAALARRALFDLSPEVREAAVGTLRNRPADGYRHILIGGLRHPWYPIADHAAEALVALGDRASLPVLQTLLDAAPPEVAGSAAVRELVKIHHLSNCLLCHPPTFNSKDPVAALVPDANQPSFGGYFGGSSSSNGPPPLFVRADVTYLRQDFSVMFAEQKRFDFVVRIRQAETGEIAHRVRSWPAAPHREAIQFAIQKLQEDTTTR